MIRRWSVVWVIDSYGEPIVLGHCWTEAAAHRRRDRCRPPFGWCEARRRGDLRSMFGFLDDEALRAYGRMSGPGAGGAVSMERP